MRRIVVLSAFCACLALAADNPLWQNLRSTYLRLKTLSGTFKETVCAANQKSCTEFEGAFAIAVPDHYRIEVTGKFRQLFVSDGTTLWIYLPIHKQVIKRSAEGFAPILAFLQPILDSTQHVDISKDSAGITVVRALVEDDMSAMKDVELELSEDNTFITGFSFTDAAGSRLHFSLDNQQWNTKLDTTMFQYAPPKGVTVDDQTVTSNPKHQ